MSAMGYEVVETYYRQALFDYYRRGPSPFYALTFDLNVDRLKGFVDQNKYRTHLNLCYFFTRAMRSVEDFRYRWLDGRIVRYEGLHPGTTVPAPGGLFSFAYFEYCEDVAVFNREAEPILREAGRRVCLEPTAHKNYIFYSALPQVRFTGLTHTASEGVTDGEPKVTFGKFFVRGGHLRVPVGIQVNHVFIDGRALGELTEAAQKAFDHPNEAFLTS